MTLLSNIDVPQLGSLEILVTPPDQVAMRGTIAIPDPGPSLGDFFRALHRAAMQDALREIVVDVRQLTFVNSSAIRLFVDWATWVRALDESSRYVIRFRTDRRVTWQRTSFTVLQSLARKAITVEAE
jgi:hypothetical protein